MQRLFVGDLSRWGIRAPEKGVGTRVQEEQIPLIDVGFLGELTRGRIKVVPGVTAFEAESVICGERRVRPDVVIAATGYSRGLDALVGHLELLTRAGASPARARTPPKALGLYFIGYSNQVTGNLRQIAIDARRLQGAGRTGGPSACGNRLR